MKRFWATVIDFIICYILSKILIGWIWEILEEIHGADLQSLSRMTVRGIKFVISFSAYFFYSFLFDRLSRGNTPGRDMVGCRFAAAGELEDNWILKHSFFKAIAAKLWFLTVFYYFIASKMPYDGPLGIGGERGVIHFAEKENRKEQYAGKRILAMLIDVGILMFILMFAALAIAGYTFIVTGGRQANIRISLTGMYGMFCYFGYFFAVELIFWGSSAGKKIVGIRLFAVGEKTEFRMILAHSILKAVSLFLWPISLIYCLATGRMFYDEWLNLEMVEGR